MVLMGRTGARDRDVGLLAEEGEGQLLSTLRKRAVETGADRNPPPIPPRNRISSSGPEKQAPGRESSLFFLYFFGGGRHWDNRPLFFLPAGASRGRAHAKIVPRRRCRPAQPRRSATKDAARIDPGTTRTVRRCCRGTFRWATRARSRETHHAVHSSRPTGARTRVVGDCGGGTSSSSARRRRQSRDPQLGQRARLTDRPGSPWRSSQCVSRTRW